MLQLAKLISGLTSNSEIILANQTIEPSNYVPSIANLREIIPNLNFISLKDSILKWIKWLQVQDSY